MKFSYELSYKYHPLATLVQEAASAAAAEAAIARAEASAAVDTAASALAEATKRAADAEALAAVTTAERDAALSRVEELSRVAAAAAMDDVSRRHQLKGIIPPQVVVPSITADAIQSAAAVLGSINNFPAPPTATEIAASSRKRKGLAVTAVNTYGRVGIDDLGLAACEASLRKKLRAAPLIERHLDDAATSLFLSPPRPVAPIVIARAAAAIAAPSSVEVSSAANPGKNDFSIVDQCARHCAAIEDAGHFEQGAATVSSIASISHALAIGSDADIMRVNAQPQTVKCAWALAQIASVTGTLSGFFC